MDSFYDLHNKLIEIRKISSELSLEHWLKAELFTLSWWLSAGLVILPWIIWWKIANKKRIFEMIGYGLFIIIIASFIDVIGSEAVFWNYPIRFLPITPRLFPFDFVIAPTIFMSIYQYFPKWKTYIMVSTVVSTVLAFIVEPLLVVLKLYELYSWKYMYSFPIYLGAAIISKWLVSKLIIRQNKG